MKKNLLLGTLVLFLLSATAFAGLSDTKKETDKPVIANTRENKLSEEELSRLTRRAETDNLSASNLSEKEMSNSKKLKAANQDVVIGNRHHGYYIGGAAIILIIILVLVLI
jgi:hypothetical protein